MYQLVHFFQKTYLDQLKDEIIKLEQGEASIKQVTKQFNKLAKELDETIKGPNVEGYVTV